jgi:uncharacterized OsmC-like protein
MDDQGSLRRFSVEARSTDTFGRVMCAARNQHFVVDGPVQNGCPGEAVTPPEIFLAGVATCGVELLQVIARAESIPLRSVSAQIEGWIDRDHPVRTDLMVFNGARLKLLLDGVTREQAASLVQKFKSR